MTRTSLSANSRLIFDRFIIESQIGSGGMAIVYCAYDTRLDRRVALKVMGSDANMGDNAERFLTEARSAARVNNSYSVGIYDSGVVNGQCFIVMEYVDGINLKMALERHGCFDATSVASIGIQLCYALEDAHGNGIVHSDVKPSNVLLRRNGNVKLADFGIARARARSVIGQRTFGTAHYVSPEQAAGQPAKPQCDIYSLGVLLYELCTSRLPASSLGNAKENGVRPGIAPTPVTFCNDTAFDEFDSILNACMQHDPNQRPSSARRLRFRLEEYVNAHSRTSAVIVPPGQPPQYWVLLPQGQQSGGIEAFKLTGRAIIGRGRDANIKLSSPTVSIMHAQITPWGACLLLSDLDSSNGTLLNGAPIEQNFICYPGDVITTGAVNLLVGCRW